MNDYIEQTCSCMGHNLDKMLQPAILTCLFGQELHGFSLIQELGKSPMCNGTEPDKTGVYRYLSRMEKQGLLTSRWDMEGDHGKPRRMYSITEKGRGCLATWYVVLKQYSEDLDALIREVGNSVGFID